MFEMLCGLRDLGYEVCAVIQTGSGDLAPKLRRAAIPFLSCDMLVSSPWDFLGLSRKVFALVKLLRRIRPDIVHYHLFTSIILGRAAAWIAGVPHRFSMITGPFYLEAPASREVDLRTLWMDTAVIASCEHVRELYARFGVKRQIELVYYGANSANFDPANADPGRLRRELGIVSEDPIVGKVAHFYPPLPAGPWTPPQLWNRGVKGHENLLKAAQIVLAQVPNVKFVLVGAGWEELGREYEAQLKRLAVGMGLERSVFFTGYRSDVPDVLAGLDVAVQCSLSENLGGTIEALLMECPTVATAVGGMVDTVRHQQTGLLVPPDDPYPLANAILDLIRDKDRAQELGRKGREWALKNFTLARTVSEIDRLYQTTACRVPDERTQRAAPVPEARYRLHRCFGRGMVLVFREVAPIADLLLRLSQRPAAVTLHSARLALASLRDVASRVAKRLKDAFLSEIILMLFGPLMTGVGCLI
jgi:glycosyltransferase involved in cell wall biosynthesis